jgi:hypothetical protein
MYRCCYRCLNRNPSFRLINVDNVLCSDILIKVYRSSSQKNVRVNLVNLTKVYRVKMKFAPVSEEFELSEFELTG